MGSNNLKKLLALIVVLVLCIGFYVWFDNYKIAIFYMYK